jgi:hypothetical protein
MSTKIKPLPSQERLNELFNYDPETGELTRKTTTNNSAKVGERAGNLDTASGYRRVKVDTSEYREHRLIWRLVTGEDPLALTVDHVNRIKDDNHWENLRLATGSQQAFNRRLQSRNTSGITGVCWDKNAGKWEVRFRGQGRDKRLGYFTTLLDAAACRISYENSHEDSHFFQEAA